MKRPPLSLAPALVAALAGLAAGPRPAAAQTTVLHDSDSYRSPQHFLLELRFGPYSPDVDNEFDGSTPHRDFFGKGHRLMTQVELDYQLFQDFGTAAVGVSLGYFRETGQAWIEPAAGVEPDTRSGDKSRFSLYPLALLAVYRADQTWRLARIPLVPYVKAGLNYTLWSVYDGNDKVASSSPSGRGRGGTLGWQAAAGAALILNVIDPGSARELDAETGINNTQLFFEFDKFASSGLGQKNRLHVGDTTWIMGLGFEF
jgi:hypothetical protein